MTVNSRILTTTIAVALAAIGATPSSWAANISYQTAGGNGNWGNPAVWQGGVVPGLVPANVDQVSIGGSATFGSSTISLLDTTGTAAFSPDINRLSITARTSGFSHRTVIINQGTGGGTLNLGSGGLNMPSGGNAANSIQITAPINLTANQTWDGAGDNGGGTQIGAVITGAFTITNTGSRSIRFSSNASTFSGFNLNSGTVLLANSSQIDGGNVLTGGPLGTGTITLSGGTLTTNDGNARTLHNNVLVNGNVTLGGVGGNYGGAGTITFSPATGSVTTFNLNSAANNVTRTLTVSNAVTINHAIGQTGGGTGLALTKAGAATLTLNAANTYTGATLVSAGTLILGASGSLANSDRIVVSSGAGLNVSAVSGGFTLGAAQTLAAGRASGFATDVTGNVTSLGTIRMASLIGTASTATFSADLNLAGGAVRYDLTNDGTTIGGGVNDLLATATLNLSAPTTLVLNPITGGAFGATTYTLATYSGALTGSEANLSILGAGAGQTRQTFTLANTGASAASITLAVTGAASALTWVGDGAANDWDLVTTANFSGGGGDNRFYNFDTVTFDDTGSANPNVDLTGTLVAAGITVNNSAVDYTFGGAGTLAGSTGIVKNGTSKLTITGAHTYLGTVAVNAGVLNIQNAGALGSAENGTTVADGAALELQGGIAVNEQLILSGSGISNGGALRNISGNNSIVISATNTATVSMLASSRINSDADTLTITRGISGTGFVLTVGGAGNVTISNLGINTGVAGSLVKDGTGTLTISASSNYDGSTTINAGTVVLGLATAINTSSGTNLGNTTGSDAASLLTNIGGTMSRNFTVRSGNTGLQTIGGNAAVTSTFSGTVNLGTNALAAKSVTLSQVAGGTAIFSGVIAETTGATGVANVTVGASTHTGIVRLSNAANTYSGNTIINGGTLEAVVLANGGTNSSIGNTGSNAAAGSAATGLQIDGATLRYIGTGGTTNRLITIGVNGATLDSAATTTALSFTGTGAFVASGSGDRTLTLTGTSSAALVNNITSVIANPSTDTTALTKSGVATWQLAGNNTYTGATDVDAGTLLVSGSLSGTSGVAVDAGATLGGTGILAPGAAGSVNVSGILAPGASIGTLTINSLNSTAASIATFASGATFSIELNTGFLADKLALTNGSAGDFSFTNNVIHFTDLSSGMLTNTSNYTLFSADVAGAYGGLTLDGSGYISSGLSIGTGLEAYVGPSSFALQVVGNDIVLTAIPEPSTGVALLGGLSALLAMRRRRS